MYRPYRASRRFNSPRPRRNFGGSSVDPRAYVNTQVQEVEQVAYEATHTFSDFGFDPRLLSLIGKKGYTYPTPIQDQAMKPILAGRDVVGIANTGTGKTAAFLLPSIHKMLQNRQERLLVMAPTRELASQIQDELRGFTTGMGIYSVLCIGGGSMNKQIWELQRQPHVLICTPGRLKDLIGRKAVNLQAYKTVVLDEVDRMLDIGFIHDIRFILGLLPSERQSLFFSATLSKDIDQLIRTFAKDPVQVSVKVRETSSQVHQDVIRVRDLDEKLEKLRELLVQDEFRKVIIFGRTKWGVEKLAIALQKNGFLAGSIHGNKSQNQRLKVLRQFKDNALNILVATDVAARGLDIDGVSHVINFDEPATYDDYVHRIGRTGRGSATGKALTFVS